MTFKAVEPRRKRGADVGAHRLQLARRDDLDIVPADELELALVIVLADADLHHLSRRDEVLVHRAPEHAAVMIGLAELRVRYIAVGIEVNDRDAAVACVETPQDRQRDRVVAADGDRDQTACDQR